MKSRTSAFIEMKQKEEIHIIPHLMLLSSPALLVALPPCEYDIHKFKIFVDDLHRLYNFEIDKAMLEDQCYGSEILFEIDRAGHIEVSGKIYGDCMIHTLEFCFDGDQTLLIPFLGGLDEQLRKIGNI